MLRGAKSKIRVHPLLLSVFIRVPLAAFRPAWMPQGLTRMNTDIHGWTRMKANASRSKIQNPCSSPSLIRVHPCSSRGVSACLDAARHDTDEHGTPGTVILWLTHQGKAS